MSPVKGNAMSKSEQCARDRFLSDYLEAAGHLCTEEAGQPQRKITVMILCSFMRDGNKRNEDDAEMSQAKLHDLLFS